MTDADIEAAIRVDPDAAPLADGEWFETARGVEPASKQAVSIRLDRDVLEWFQNNSERYQTKINAVLRSYMEHEQKKRRAKRLLSSESLQIDAGRHEGIHKSSGGHGRQAGDDSPFQAGSLPFVLPVNSSS